LQAILKEANLRKKTGTSNYRETSEKTAKRNHSPACLCVGEGNRKWGAAEAILFQLGKNT